VSSKDHLIEAHYDHRARSANLIRIASGLLESSMEYSSVLEWIDRGLVRRISPLEMDKRTGEFIRRANSSGRLGREAVERFDLSTKGAVREPTSK